MEGWEYIHIDITKTENIFSLFFFCRIYRAKFSVQFDFSAFATHLQMKVYY